MKMYKRVMTLVLLFFASLAEAQEIEMADTFRAEGKIYVVVAVVLIMLIGLLLYLLRIDKRLKKIENE